MLSPGSKPLPLFYWTAVTAKGYTALLRRLSIPPGYKENSVFRSLYAILQHFQITINMPNLGLNCFKDLGASDK